MNFLESNQQLRDDWTKGVASHRIWLICICFKRVLVISHQDATGRACNVCYKSDWEWLGVDRPPFLIFHQERGNACTVVRLFGNFFSKFHDFAAFVSSLNTTHAAIRTFVEYPNFDIWLLDVPYRVLVPIYACVYVQTKKMQTRIHVHIQQNGDTVFAETKEKKKERERGREMGGREKGSTTCMASVRVLFFLTMQHSFNVTYIVISWFGLFLASRPSRSCLWFALIRHASQQRNKQKKKKKVFYFIYLFDVLLLDWSHQICFCFQETRIRVLFF